MNLFYNPYNGKDKNEFEKKSVEYFHEDRSCFKGNNLKYLVLFSRESLSNDTYISDFNDTISHLCDSGLKPSDIVFAYYNNYSKKTFSKKELGNLKKLDMCAKSLGVTAGVFDYKDVFDYQSVANADKIIKEQANAIKKNNYSPLEKLLHSYLIVSNREYEDENKRTDNLSISRSVYGVLNGDKIVCAGFSEYIKALVNEIDDPNLTVFANNISVQNYKKGKIDNGPHQNNIVYIKDDKYKIDGFYYLDATWDEGEKETLHFFLLEIDNVKNIKSYSTKIEMRDFYEELVKKRNRISKYRAQKNKGKISHREPKDRSIINYYKTVPWSRYGSLSSCKLNLMKEIEFVDVDDPSDTLLSKFLLSRQDFKDYVVLYETMHNVKNSNLGFDKLLEKNAKIAEEDITKLNTMYNDKALFKYLKKHSPHIDVGPIQNALQKVLTAMYPKKSKDEISKKVYDVIKDNIVSAKNENFNNAKTIWTELEDLK